MSTFAGRRLYSWGRNRQHMYGACIHPRMLDGHVLPFAYCFSTAFFLTVISTRHLRRSIWRWKLFLTSYGCWHFVHGQQWPKHQWLSIFHHLYKNRLVSFLYCALRPVLFSSYFSSGSTTSTLFLAKSLTACLRLYAIAANYFLFLGTQLFGLKVPCFRYERWRMYPLGPTQSPCARSSWQRYAPSAISISRSKFCYFIHCFKLLPSIARFDALTTTHSALVRRNVEARSLAAMLVFANPFLNIMLNMHKFKNGFPT